MLAEALSSVRAQTFTDYAVLVVSNGQNADMDRASREVVVAYAQHFEVAAANVSVVHNFGIARAKGLRVDAGLFGSGRSARAGVPSPYIIWDPGGEGDLAPPFSVG